MSYSGPWSLPSGQSCPPDGFQAAIHVVHQVFRDGQAHSVEQLQRLLVRGLAESRCRGSIARLRHEFARLTDFVALGPGQFAAGVDDALPGFSARVVVGLAERAPGGSGGFDEFINHFVVGGSGVGAQVLRFAVRGVESGGRGFVDVAQ